MHDAQVEGRSTISSIVIDSTGILPDDLAFDFRPLRGADGDNTLGDKVEVDTRTNEYKGRTK